MKSLLTTFINRKKYLTGVAFMASCIGVANAQGSLTIRNDSAQAMKTYLVYNNCYKLLSSASDSSFTIAPRSVHIVRYDIDQNNCKVGLNEAGDNNSFANRPGIIYKYLKHQTEAVHVIGGTVGFRYFSSSWTVNNTASTLPADAAPELIYDWSAMKISGGQALDEVNTLSNRDNPDLAKWFGDATLSTEYWFASTALPLTTKGRLVTFSYTAVIPPFVSVLP